MKKLALIGIMVFVVSQGYAQAPGGRQRNPQGQFQRPNKQEILKKYDLNGDGVLSDEERAKMFADRPGGQGRSPGGNMGQQGRQPEMGGQPGPGRMPNGGGQTENFSPEQMNAKINEKMQKMQKENPEKYQKILKKFDLNADGTLDSHEMGQMKVERQQRGFILKQFDENQDGKLDDKEKANFQSRHLEMMTTFSQRNPELYQKVMQEFDTNKNSQLDFEEWNEGVRSGKVPPPGNRGGDRAGFDPPNGPRQGGNQRPSMGDPGQGQQQRPPMNQPQPEHAGSAKVEPKPDDGGLLDGIKTNQDQKRSGPDVDDDLDMDFLDF